MFWVLCLRRYTRKGYVWKGDEKKEFMIRNVYEGMLESVRKRRRK